MIGSKKHKLLACLILLLPALFILPAFAHAKGIGSFDSPFDKINAARQRGKISKDYSTYLKLVALREPKKLPDQFRGVPVKSATFIVRELQNEIKQVKDKRIKKKIDEQFGGADHDSRVLFKGGMKYQDIISFLNNESTLPKVDNLTVSYSPDSSNFKIWYTNSGDDAVPNADENGSGVPDYVENLGTELEMIWQRYFSEMGFKPVPGWSSKYNVFLKNLQSAQGFAYGFTGGSGSGYSWPSFVMIENDFEGFPSGTPETNTKITAAHEFFHAVQYGYNPFSTDYYYINSWWMEATATWAEDEIYPDINDYLNYLYAYSSKTGEEGWFAYPEYSLATWDDETYYHYGSSIFVKYLAEKKGGVPTIKKIWENLAGKSMYEEGRVFYFINKTLQDLGRGTLNSALADFRVKNFILSGYKDYAQMKALKNAKWTDYKYNVWITKNHLSYPVGRTQYSGLPEYLGTNYIIFKPDSGYGKTKVFEFAGKKDTTGKYEAGWLVKLMLRDRETKNYVTKNVVSTNKKSGLLKITGFGTNSTYDRAVMVASVLSPKKSNVYYKYSYWVRKSSAASISSSVSSVKKGKNVRFRGKLTPKHAKMANVILQKSVDGKAWNQVGKMTWNSKAEKYIYDRKPYKTLYYRIKWGGDGDHATAYSKRIRVSVY